MGDAARFMRALLTARSVTPPSKSAKRNNRLLSSRCLLKQSPSEPSKRGPWWRVSSCRQSSAMTLGRASILFVGLASMGLSLAAFALQPTARPNYVLPAFLLALSLLWLGAGAALGGSANHWPDMRLDAGASLLLVGGLSLSLELAVRLVCAGRFGGFPAAFDFGLKCKEVHALDMPAVRV